MTSLAGRRFLLAPGLAGELYRAMRRLGVDYMHSQAEWLKAQGAAVEIMPCQSGAAICVNADAIEAALCEAPATIIAHSKGGLETLEALLRPAAAARCEGFIAFQSPFGGSPIADLLIARPPLHGAARRLGQWLGIGDGAGLIDLTCASRAAWMADHAEGIAALVASVPVVTVASILPEERRGPDRRYRPLAAWIERHGHGPNDGLVTVESALIPGARYWIAEAGHRGLVASGEGRDPIGALRHALSLLEAPLDSAG
ncbi:hypothetical protein IAI18_11760 [Acetobacteraceae bacterium H6797]|nr:hypothetical protein [Acetobacteraceae bacterium H6797]